MLDIHQGWHAISKSIITASDDSTLPCLICLIFIFLIQLMMRQSDSLTESTRTEVEIGLAAEDEISVK